MSIACTVPPERRERFTSAGHWRDLTLGESLARTATRLPDQVALVDGARRMTYRQLEAASGQLAWALQEEGIGPGDVVSVQLPNSLEFVLVHLALARLGAVTGTIHMAYGPRETAFILRYASSVAAIVAGAPGTADRAEAVAAAAGELPELRHLVVVGERAPAGARTLAEVLAAHPPPADLARRLPEISPDSPFVLLFTSGTEADPKAVVHTHNTMVSNAWWAAREDRLTERDTILSVSPMSHLFGLFTIHMGVIAGATQVVLPTFDPARFLRLCQEERVTFAVAVPAQLYSMLALPDFSDHDLSSLREILTGGTFVPESLVRETHRRFGCAVCTQWGMTEVGAGVFVRPDEDVEVSCRSVGRVVPGGEISILDDGGRLLPVGTEGELAFRGASLFVEYLGNPRANQAARTADGWFRTGDIGAIDPEGRLRLTGRLKDIIDRGGFKYSPLEVEELLLTHEQIAQAAIVAMPDPRLGQRACAFVALQPGAHLDLAEVCAFLTARGVARVKLPERLEVRPTLPTTPTRKLQKAPLREEIRRLVGGSTP